MCLLPFSPFPPNLTLPQFIDFPSLRLQASKCLTSFSKGVFDFSNSCHLLFLALTTILALFLRRGQKHVTTL
jgi:hypothetical protein